MNINKASRILTKFHFLIKEEVFCFICPLLKRTAETSRKRMSGIRAGNKASITHCAYLTKIELHLHCENYFFKERKWYRKLPKYLRAGIAKDVVK